MGDRSFVETAHSARPVEEVWARLADAAGWKAWAPFSRSSLEQEGHPAPDGVGAIRRFGTGPITSREEVVAFEPPHHLAYRLLSGLPVRGYRADVTLTAAPDGHGTDIEWRSSWAGSAPPAALWRRIMHDAVRRVAKALAKS